MEETCKEEKKERFINYLMGRLEIVGTVLHETASINDDSLLRFGGPNDKKEIAEKESEVTTDKEKIERLLSGLDRISDYINSQAQNISSII